MTLEEKIQGYVAVDENRTFSELMGVVVQLRLKDKALCDGIKRDELSKEAELERSTLYTMLRVRFRAMAEKVAATLEMKLEKAFNDATEKKGLSGASTNKLKLNPSVIFTAIVNIFTVSFIQINRFLNLKYRSMDYLKH